MMHTVQVAVTGGTGFVGRAVCSALLARGHEVATITRTEAAGPAGVRTIRGDLLDGPSIDALLRDAEVVVNAAGLVRSSDAAAMRRANVDALVALVDRCDDVARVVQVSSAGVHGLPGGLVDEGSPLAPANPYEASKAEAEVVLFERRPTGSVVVRPTNILGVGHPLDPLVRFLRAVAAGRVWTWSGAWTNYVGVDVVAEAVVAATFAPEPPRRLLVNDPRPLVDLARLAAAVMGTPDRTHRAPAAMARALRPVILAAASRVGALHRVASLLETTHFETAHSGWFAEQQVDRDIEPTLRAMVQRYRERGKL